MLIEMIGYLVYTTNDLVVVVYEQFGYFVTANFHSFFVNRFTHSKLIGYNLAT